MAASYARRPASRQADATRAGKTQANAPNLRGQLRFLGLLLGLRAARPSTVSSGSRRPLSAEPARSVHAGCPYPALARPQKYCDASRFTWGAPR